MLEKGFIIMHRKMVNWEWYQNPNVKATFLHLLLTANYEDREWEGIIVKRGQRVASYNTLSAEIGISKKTAFACIKKLEKTGELERSAYPKYTVFTVVKYNEYQDNGTQGIPLEKRKGNDEETQGIPNVTKINKANKEEQKNGAPPEQISDGYVAKRKF